MFAKSDDLRRSLSEIDQLLHALRASSIGHGVDLDEIDMLESSRRAMVNLLEARRRQNKAQIVSMQAWRNGDLSMLPLMAERFASLGHPQPGKPHLHRVS